MEEASKEGSQQGVKNLILYDSQEIYELDTQGSSGTSHGQSVIRASPTSDLIAFSHAHSRSVTIIGANLEVERRLERVFNPEYEPSVQTDAKDGIINIAWNHDGSRLACLSDKGFLFVLNCDAIMIGHWGPKQWNGDKAIDLFWRQDSCYVLNSRGEIYMADQRDAPSLVLNLKSIQPKTVGVAYQEELDELLTISEGQEPHFLAIKAWKFVTAEELSQTWQYGASRRAGFIYWSTKSTVSWQSAYFQGSLAIRNPEGTVLIANVKRESEDTSPTLAIYEVIEGANSVCWWTSSIFLTVKNGDLKAHDLNGPVSVDLLTPPVSRLHDDAVVHSQTSQGNQKNSVFILHRKHSSEKKKVTWVVTKLLESSAQAKLEQLILAEQWEAALLLSDAHNLDKDLVRRAQWAQQNVTKASIQEFWNSISDRKKAAESCLERTASSFSTQKLLLETGLTETETHLKGDLDEESWLEWASLRIQILSHLERLTLLTQTLSRDFSPTNFREIRDLSGIQIAIHFAHHSDLKGLEMLLEKFPFSVGPRFLDAIIELPETMQPSHWIHLVQKYMQMTRPEFPQSLDFIESKETIKRLKQQDQFALTSATENLSSLSVPFIPPSPISVSKWFREKILRVDSVIGSLALSKSIIEAGLKVVGENDSNLQELFHALEEMGIVANYGGELGWDLKLREYSSLNLTGRLKMILQFSKADSIEQDRDLVSKILKKYPEEEQEDFLIQLFSIIADTKFDWVCQLFQQEVRSDLKVFPNPRVLVRSALAFLYGFNGLTEWDNLQVLSQNLLDFLDHSSVPRESEEITALQQAVLHIYSGKALCDLDMGLKLQEIKDCTPGKAREMIESCLTHLKNSHPSETRWTSVWKKLRDLQDTAWPYLSKQEILASLCSNLLMCGEWKLARNYLTGTGSTPIPLEDSEKIVITAARQYLDSATNVTGPEIDQAARCLDVLSGSQIVDQERKVVGAILNLRSLGVHILPAQFREVENRLGLLQAVLDSKPGIYQDHSILLSISQSLGLSTHQNLELQIMTANAALREGDEEFAREQCVKLVHAGHKNAWTLASQLSSIRSSMTQHPEDVKIMLGFALAHCPTEQISSHMSLWRSAPWMQIEKPQHPYDTIAKEWANPIQKSTHNVTNSQAISYVLQAGNGSKEILEDCIKKCLIEGIPPRRVMLLGIVTSAFQIGIESLAKSKKDVPQIASEAEQLLTLPPQILHRRILRLNDGSMNLDHRDIPRYWKEQLENDTRDQKLNTLMNTAHSGHANGSITKEESLLQIASKAGKNGLKAQKQMKEALVMAERYRVDKWLVKSTCLENLILESTGPLETRTQFASWLLKDDKSNPEVLAKIWEIMLGLEDMQILQISLSLKVLALLRENEENVADSLNVVSNLILELGKYAPEFPFRGIVQHFLTALIPELTNTSQNLKLDGGLLTRRISDQVSNASVQPLCSIVEQFVDLSRKLNLDERIWPSSSKLRLICFGKELSKASRNHIAEVYASVSQLLVTMESNHIISAVEFLSSSGSSPDINVKPMSRFVNRTIRLQALQDAIGLLNERSLSDEQERRKTELEDLSEALKVIVSMASNAELSPGEQDLVEKAYFGSKNWTNALSQLFLRGIPFGKIEASSKVIDELNGSAENPQEFGDIGLGISEKSQPTLNVSHIQRVLEMALDLALESENNDTVKSYESLVCGLEGLVQSLEEDTSGNVNIARKIVWKSMNDHVLKNGPKRVQVLELLSSITTSSQKPSRWLGWNFDAQFQQDHEASLDVRIQNLWTQTLIIAQQILDDQNDVTILPEEVSTVQKGTDTFLRLLSKANTKHQFILLANLLNETWQNGEVFQNAKEETQTRKRKQQNLLVADSLETPAFETVTKQSDGEEANETSLQSPEEIENEMDGWHQEDLDFESSPASPIPDTNLEIHPETENKGTSSRKEKVPSGVHRSKENWQDDLEEIGEGWGLDEDLSLDLDLPANTNKLDTDLTANNEDQGLLEKVQDSQRSGVNRETGPQKNSEGLSLVESQAKPFVEKEVEKVNLEQQEGKVVFEDDVQDLEEVCVLHESYTALFQAILREGLPEIALQILDKSDSLINRIERQKLIDMALKSDSHYGALLALFLLEDRESSQIFEALRSVTTSPQNLTPESLLLIASRGYVKLTVKNGLFDSLRIALLRISKLDLGHQSPIETWHQVLLPVLASQLSSSGDQEVAAQLAAQHLCLHPALFTKENNFAMLNTLLKACLSENYSERVFSRASYGQSILPKTLEQFQASYLDIIKLALADLETAL